MTEIKVLKNEQDFGKIKIGEKLEGYFIIRNTGSENLVYQNVITDCSCTTLIKKNDKVSAGSTDTLRFTLNTEGKEKGTMKRFLRIITNTKPDLHTFSIKAELE